MGTRLIIERKGTGLDWEIVAHPRDDLEEALETLEWLRREDLQKKYRGAFRLVRVTREVIHP